MLKKALPNTKLQMLLRGQNILGYRNYPDDVLDKFCKKSIENGIDVVRIFDALNDTRNVKKAMECVKEYGGLCEPAMSYTIIPIHNEQYFIDPAMKLEDMGADVICIKDMANLLLPMAAYSLVSKLKKRVSAVHLHTHNTPERRHGQSHGCPGRCGYSGLFLHRWATGPHSSPRSPQPR